MNERETVDGRSRYQIYIQDGGKERLAEQSGTLARLVGDLIEARQRGDLKAGSAIYQEIKAETDPNTGIYGIQGLTLAEVSRLSGYNV